MRLPVSAAVADHTTEEQAATVEREAKRHHVLIAEDNAINQFVIEEIMEALGCRCTIVSDGRACVELIKQRHYDLVLMDCEMPVMDGYDAMRNIRRFEHSRGRSPVPIVALTAHADESNRHKAQDAGMTDFATKPFTLQDISDVLDRNLDTPQALRAAS